MWRIPPSYYLTECTTLEKYAFDSTVALFMSNIESEIYPAGYEEKFYNAQDEAEKRLETNKENRKASKNKNLDMSKIL